MIQKKEEEKMKAKISTLKITVPAYEKTVAGLKKIIPALKYKTGLRNLLTGFTGSSGATLIEIALYVALVVIVCIAVITALGDKLQGVFATIVSSL
jgi:hypothetical protein